MRSGGAPDGASLGARAFGQAEASPEVQRLRQVGERLFEVSFVLHDGYLGATDAAPREASECPWDTGELDLPLLARAPATEDALQLARRVVLHCLHHPQRTENVESLLELWQLGRWTLCHDPGLIGTAFSLLTTLWRTLAGLPGLGDLTGPQLPSGSGASLLSPAGRQASEATLFRMFTDLEVWRLPDQALLTPWVPGQVLVSHVAAQCRVLEDRQLALVEQTRENLEEIARLHSVIAQLGTRLEATDARSQQCMNKQADLNDALRRLR